MIPLGLSSAQLAELHTTLATHHHKYVTVQLLTMNHTRLADLSWRLLDGQVNIDANGEVTRSCSLSLLDPNRTMSFDTESPDDGAVYMDRMVQVNYSVKRAAEGAEWVTIPLFTGPVSKLDRTNDVVNIEAQGKEVITRGPIWTPITFKKGLSKVEVIRQLLQLRGGETKFSLSSNSARLPSDYSIGRLNSAWGVAQHVARGMGMQLFYDGRGVVRLQPVPRSSVFHFREGDGGTVLSQPQISYQGETVRNLVWVVGGTPKGATKPIEAVAVAPASHPLSPARLGRNGVPRYLVERVENSTIGTQAEATRLANQTLTRMLMLEVDVKFDAFPIPHLEPGDMARLYGSDTSTAFWFTNASIPLRAGRMSVGYQKRVSVNHRRIRR